MFVNKYQLSRVMIYYTRTHSAMSLSEFDYVENPIYK